jgi:aminoglycoside phosphotransferase (APT) family kinase protein
VSHGARLCAQVREQMARCRKASPATTDADCAWVEAVVAANRSALDEPFTPRCVHHDWAPGNVLLEGSPDGGWRVSGVLDLMTADFSDGEEDLVRLAAALAVGDRERVRARALVAAYREHNALRPGFAER